MPCLEHEPQREEGKKRGVETIQLGELIIYMRICERYCSPTLNGIVLQHSITPLPSAPLDYFGYKTNLGVKISHQLTDLLVLHDQKMRLQWVMVIQ
jgi:hypothetical protein